jgi:cobalt-zinc-cadmium resistance protein CzcA
MPQILELIFRYRFIVLSAFGVLVLIALQALFMLPVDAFPDTTPIQVQINTVAPALGPEEMERQITDPIEQSISGLPGLIEVRSLSKFGLSQVVAIFDDHTGIYDARQLVFERITSVELPDGIEPPELGPISTGLGEVFHYTVRSKNPNRPLDEVRTIHDWMIKPALRKVSGVAEVNSWGGFELQYQVIIQPDVLAERGLTLDEVVESLQKNNRNYGGGEIVSGGQSVLVHGIGRLSTLEDIGNVVIRSQNGTPVRVFDIASVKKGHEIRRGAVTANGAGEVVLGLGFMLIGENSKEVTEGLAGKLTEVKIFLPKDIEVEVVYDRTHLVHEVITTVRHNLIAGAVLVVGILFLIMGNFRAGLVVAMTIPFAALFAFLGMYHFAIAASLLSLGAMDFGVLVDGSIVLMDANLKRLSETSRTLGRSLSPQERMAGIIASGREVMRPIIFGLGIITLVFIPILTLDNIEGKMFRPMAWTFIFALLGALLTTILLSPLLTYYALPTDFKFKENRFITFLQVVYQRLFGVVMAKPRRVLIGIALLLTVTCIIGLRLGGEFVPRLSEGSLVINVIRLAGVSLDESVRYNGRIEQMLLDQFPDEVDKCWSRIGSAEIATDPMGTELTDIFITLKPRKSWKQARTQQQLSKKIDSVMTDLPGINYVFTQPIEMRINEMVSGIRSDLGIKIIGDNFDTLVALSDRVQTALGEIPGVADIAGEQITGQPLYQITLNRENMARYGVPSSKVLEMVALNGNYRAGELQQEQRRFPITIRLPDEYRTNPSALSQMQLSLGEGKRLPLGSLVNFKLTEGPATINHEWGRRLIKVQCNVQNRDISSFVSEARTHIKNTVPLPEGYLIEWGGQFENLERSKMKFIIVVPLTLLLIFFLLYYQKLKA